MNLIGSGSGNKIKKVKNNIYSKFYYLIDEARKIHDDESVLIGISSLIHLIDNYQHNNNIDTIVCIGDSPSIIMQILKLLWKMKYENRYNKKIKYLPISGLGSAKESIIKNKLINLSDFFEKKERILWVDFIASGNSFINFYNNMPVKLKKNSFYFGYGYVLHNWKVYEKRNNLIRKLLKQKKMYYYEIDDTSLFRTFLRKITGFSEFYDIRCIKYSIIDENYKVNLFDKVPTKNTKNSKYCNLIALAIFDILVERNFILP